MADPTNLISQILSDKVYEVKYSLIKTLLNLENIGVLVLALYVLLAINSNPLLLVLTFFLPDVSIAAYLINNRIGAYIYNLFHHKGLAALLIVIGHLILNFDLIYAGGIIIAHSTVDRFLGFGLKYTDDFKHTHLGFIRKKS